jgi:hypothetical protein
MMTKFISGVVAFGIILCCSDCTHNPVTPVVENDSTSHAWTFTINYLGDGGGGIPFDVAIINDTLAYAVGKFFIYDSTGRLDPRLYNFAIWNGYQWKLKKIPYDYNGIQTYQYIPWLYEVDENDIWLGNSTHWDGKQFQNIDIGISIFFGVETYKMWGTKNNLYAVGDNGTIGRYNGTGWQKMQSGTNLNIYDIFGFGSTVLAIASNPFESLDKKVMQINGTTVTQLSTDSIHGPLNSVWFVPGHYYVVGQGIYEKNSLVDNAWHQDRANTVDFFSCIRGNAWNDIFVSGGFGQLLHYNGKSWQSYQDAIGLQGGSIGNIAVKGNLMMGVGSLGSNAVVIIGTRRD